MWTALRRMGARVGLAQRCATASQSVHWLDRARCGFGDRRWPGRCHRPRARSAQVMRGSHSMGRSPGAPESGTHSSGGAVTGRAGRYRTSGGSSTATVCSCPNSSARCATAPRSACSKRWTAWLAWPLRYPVRTALSSAITACSHPMPAIALGCLADPVRAHPAQTRRPRLRPR